VDRNEFNQAAVECFGDAVQVAALDLEWCNKLLKEALDRPRDPREPWPRDESAYASLTQAEIDEYGEWTWCEDCPCCGEPLNRVFIWGIVNGEGTCSNCNKAAFSLYHRLREGMYPIIKYALIGF